MKNIRYDGYKGPRLPPKMQMERVNRVIAEELTTTQREVFTAYYLQEMTIPEIAQMRGVNKSAVCRSLKRAENRVRRFLMY